MLLVKHNYPIRFEHTLGSHLSTCYEPICSVKETQLFEKTYEKFRKVVGKDYLVIPRIHHFGIYSLV